MKSSSRQRKSRVTGRGGVHGRTMNFFEAAARRLAWNDYERVSVTMICRDARSTPYTFYRRFPNKHAFLYALVLVTFRSRTTAFADAMHAFGSQKRTVAEIIDRIVDEVIAGTMTVFGIGATQLAVRVGMSKPIGAEPYITYRETVADRAAALLSPERAGYDQQWRVRSAVQILFAIATDEAWRHGIPFTTARKRALAAEYGRLMSSLIGIKENGGKHGRLSYAILPEWPFPEAMKTAYPLSKRALRSYEKEVNASQRPEFPLPEPIEPLDALIAVTREENRKTEKPIKSQKPKSVPQRRRQRFRIV